MDFDQKLLLLQSQLSRRYVYTASVTSGETSSLATGLPAKPQETITRIQFNIYINQSNFLGSLHSVAWGERATIGRASNEGHSRQAVAIPFYSCVEQVFAVFIFKR